MDPCTSFGAWLRQWRTARDLTREDLARRAGYSVSALRKIETDERRLSRPTFLRVARGDLPVDYIIVSPVVKTLKERVLRGLPLSA
jgi:transcriptional regulator with XRE-family HTH domain